MKRQILYTASIFSAAFALVGCNQAEGQSDASAPESAVEEASVDSAKEHLRFESEYEYQSKMGNPADNPQPKSAFFQKKIAQSIGARITIPRFFIYAQYSDDWLKGGKLIVSNDASMGTIYRIACYLSPEQGDAFMADGQRQEVDITGVISEYSTDYGLDINPCEITRADFLKSSREPDPETVGESLDDVVSEAERVASEVEAASDF